MVETRRRGRSTWKIQLFFFVKLYHGNPFPAYSFSALVAGVPTETQLTVLEWRWYELSTLPAAEAAPTCIIYARTNWGVGPPPTARRRWQLAARRCERREKHQYHQSVRCAALCSCRLSTWSDRPPTDPRCTDCLAEWQTGGLRGLNFGFVLRICVQTLNVFSELSSI